MADARGVAYNASATKAELVDTFWRASPPRPRGAESWPSSQTSMACGSASRPRRAPPRCRPSRLRCGRSAATSPLRATTGDENFSDNTRFGDIVSFVNSIQGTGTPVCQATLDDAALLSYLFFGQEDVHGQGARTTSPPKYEFEPGAIGLVLHDVVEEGRPQRGRAPAVQRHEADGLADRGLDGEQGRQDQPDPDVARPGRRVRRRPGRRGEHAHPVLYTEGAAKFDINGVVFRCQSQFAIAVVGRRDAVLRRLDSAVRHDRRAVTVTIEGLTVLLNAASLSLYNEIVYGTPSPAPGTKPTSVISEDRRVLDGAGPDWRDAETCASRQGRPARRALGARRRCAAEPGRRRDRADPGRDGAGRPRRTRRSG